MRFFPYLLVITAAKNIGTLTLPFSIAPNAPSPVLDSYGALQLDKRSDGTHGTLLAELKSEGTWYSVPLKIGSQGDEVTVLLDTGSSDLWVSSSSNTYCQPGTASPHQKYRVIEDSEGLNALLSPKSNTLQGLQNKATDQKIDCSEFGTFDSHSSKSFHSNSTPFYIQYADKTFARGQWGTDTITMSGLNIEGMSLAVANESDSGMGVLGIGLEGLQSTIVGSLVGKYFTPYTYANLPTKLVQDGIIDRRVFSLFLDTKDAKTGSVLFGGVDHSKYEGDLQILPLVNSYSDHVDKPIRFEVAVQDITINNEGKSSNFLSGGDYYANLDSGTTYSYFPKELLDRIGKSFSMSYSSYQGLYYMDCPTDEKLAKIAITFSFQGKIIEVPFADFIKHDENSGVCILTILDSGKDQGIVLGDNFLRAVYVVYDLDRYEVAIATATYEGQGEVQAVVDDIPGAVKQDGSTGRSQSSSSSQTVSSSKGISSSTSSSIINSKSTTSSSSKSATSSSSKPNTSSSSKSATSSGSKSATSSSSKSTTSSSTHSSSTQSSTLTESSSSPSRQSSSESSSFSQLATSINESSNLSSTTSAEVSPTRTQTTSETSSFTTETASAPASSMSANSASGFTLPWLLGAVAFNL